MIQINRIKNPENSKNYLILGKALSSSFPEIPSMTSDSLIKTNKIKYAQNFNLLLNYSVKESRQSRSRAQNVCNKEI